MNAQIETQTTHSASLIHTATKHEDKILGAGFLGVGTMVMDDIYGRFVPTHRGWAQPEDGPSQYDLLTSLVKSHFNLRKLVGVPRDSEFLTHTDFHSMKVRILTLGGVTSLVFYDSTSAVKSLSRMQKNLCLAVNSVAFGAKKSDS
jgi:hypothetical protein